MPSPRTSRFSRRAVATALPVALMAGVVAAPAGASDSESRSPEETGYLGAVSSIDPNASEVGISVLRDGGNAVDAAVATAAALGVTDPFSGGIGGGGFFMHYEAKTGKVHALDGRETAPSDVDSDLFVENGEPIPFDEAVTSGRSVGAPGTPLTWQHALDRWGSRPLARMVEPAEKLARDGFTVDEEFHRQVAENADRFGDFPATRDIYLRGGEPPAVGSRFTNPDLAETYGELATNSIDSVYGGDIGADIVRTVQDPPVDPDADRDVRAGTLSESDIANYSVVEREPTKTSFKGHDVYGMPAPSAGGISVGEALNMLEPMGVPRMSDVDYLHHFLEASRLSFADRDRWVGDPAFSDVPADGLLSQRFADSRGCLLDPDHAAQSPVPPGDPNNPLPCGSESKAAGTPYEGENTTHLTTADRWGNIVAYTLTIEQEGGSGIVVPDRGFLLNNELTDFSMTPVNPEVPDPNLPGPNKRPRSSMAPTIVADNDKPSLAVGSPGGASIITTVLQILLGRLERDQRLVDAIAQPRASQRNSDKAQVEQQFLDGAAIDELRARGQRFSDEPGEIGAATGVERLADGRWLAAAEPERRGGGSARVVLRVGDQ